MIWGIYYHYQNPQRRNVYVSNIYEKVPWFFFLCTPKQPTDFAQVASYQVHPFLKTVEIGSSR